MIRRQTSGVAVKEGWPGPAAGLDTEPQSRKVAKGA